MSQPDFVRVQHKHTKAKFTIDRINVTDDVEVLDEPAIGEGGPLLPEPHVEPQKAAEPNDANTGDNASQPGTKKKGSI